MKPLIIYHGNCYDGFGAAWAAWKIYGDNGAQYHAALYGNKPPIVQHGDNVYLLDFTYPRTVIEEWAQYASITVLDHHKTAQADLCGEWPENVRIVFDMKKSGAVLAWEHFHDTPVPEFSKYLQDRDLWLFQMEASKQISMAMRAYPFDFRTWDVLAVSLERLADEGATCERMTEQQVIEMAKNVRMLEIGGHTVPVVNATVHFSEVGDYLCRKYPEAPFAGYYLDRGDGKRQWGFRSRGDFDVGEMCKQYGGGGHRMAAGFVTEERKAK